MKIPAALIHSNIFISLAAVALTVSAQIQLGTHPQWHPCLFIIFFATLFEYNLHRLITVLTNKEALRSEKHRWVNENLTAFYILIFVSVVGFVVVALMASRKVLMTFAPIALVTLLYSVPVSKTRIHLLRLREIPYLKIFVIAAVWSTSTVLLPVVQTPEFIERGQVAYLLMSRFFFVLAITIPFDIRDMEPDRAQQLKTIPILLGEKRSLRLSYLFLFIFGLISAVQYIPQKKWLFLCAICISGTSTFLFLKLQYFRKLPFYHYGILDGTLLLQGLMILGAFCLTYS